MLSRFLSRRVLFASAIFLAVPVVTMLASIGMSWLCKGFGSRPAPEGEHFIFLWEGLFLIFIFDMPVSILAGVALLIILHVMFVFNGLSTWYVYSVGGAISGVAYFFPIGLIGMMQDVLSQIGPWGVAAALLMGSASGTAFWYIGVKSRRTPSSLSSKSVP
ncbi:MAG: hypothetical protein HY985_04710 [Magnetospirillum sp.]|nr:hypothetical protein [Magnetospirillum sp.]